MTKRQKIIARVTTTVILGTVLAVVLTHRRQPVTLRGSVLRQDVDPNKQLPVADVEITAVNGLGSGKSKSDASGFFSLTLPRVCAGGSQSCCNSAPRATSLWIGMISSVTSFTLPV